jgi:hypothetical protein
MKVVAPTGQYHPTVLINPGTNRCGLKPEFGISQRWGKWIFDAYTGVWFYTKNPEFFSFNEHSPGVNTLSQAPVATLETHICVGALVIGVDRAFGDQGQQCSQPTPFTRASRCLIFRKRRLIKLAIAPPDSIPSITAVPATWRATAFEQPPTATDQDVGHGSRHGAEENEQ